MMDGSVLLQMNMSFNPFRSTTSIHRHDEQSSIHRQSSSADSWHSNSGLANNNNISINNKNSNPHNSEPSYRSSTALSWIQSWTLSTNNIIPNNINNANTLITIKIIQLLVLRADILRCAIV